MQRDNLAPATARATESRGVVAALVYVFERVMPDPFVLSICLTAFVALLAFAIAPQGKLPTVLDSWYTGTFGILGFALQMILILATGYAIAEAPIVQRGLRAMASRAQTPARAALLVFPVVAVAAWLNWGLGLIVGALLSREIARRVRVDFAWLVAGSYSAWSICNSGLSSSIALSQASHGNALNLVEKATGQVVPLGATVFAPFVFIPTVLVVVVMTAIFIRMHPREAHVVAFDDAADRQRQAPGDDPHARVGGTPSFATRLEQSVLGTLLLLAFGIGFLVMEWRSGHFDLDINTTILIFLLIGLALQRTPIAYANAIRGAARQTGSMLLQYPVYGGIMGMMKGTGLASMIAKAFVTIATPLSLPLWSYLQLADHHPAGAERRRPLGRAGPLRAAGRAEPARLGAAHRHGRGDGRERLEHAAAVLGRADRGDRRDPHPARDGIHGGDLRGVAGDLRAGAVAGALSAA